MSWNNQPPPAPGPNPYVAPPARPGWTRKRVLLPAAFVVLFIGVGIGGSGSDTNTKKTADAKPLPAATVTARRPRP